MPRDGGGIYTLPGGNPVVTGTIIDTQWANPTMEDVAAAMSDSLSRSGKGGMTFSLRGPDGSAAIPTFSFTNETSSGRYRDGPGTIVEAVLGIPVVRYTVSGLEQWNGVAWEPLTPRDAIDTPFDPAPTALTSTNVQDAIEEVFASTGGTVTAANVTYDDSLVYFGAPTVQLAIDTLGIDLSAVASDVATNAGDIQVLEGEIDILDSTILGMIGDINLNEQNIALNAAAIVNLGSDNDDQNDRLDDAESDIIVNAAGIAQNLGIINQHTSLINTNASNISANVNAINQNASDISGNTTAIGVNAGNISSNLGKINTNTGDISDNTTLIGNNFNDITTLQNYFTGNVLEVSHGGTGVTSKTGTGSVVLNDDPVLTGSPQTPTFGTGTSSTIIASTKFVHDVGDVEWGYGVNSNGIWWKHARSGFIIQWGWRTVAANSTVTYNFPLAFTVAGDSNDVGAVCSYQLQGTAEVDPPAIWAQSKSQYKLSNSMSSSRRIGWTAMG